MTTSRSRRDFLKTSAVLAAAAGVTGARGAVRETSGLRQEFYELRMYKAPTPDKQNRVGAYLEHALIPALGRMGIQRVGVFTNMDVPTESSIYVLIPYVSLDVFAAVNPRLLSDPLYQDAATAHFAVPKDNPLFSRIHRWFSLQHQHYS